MICLTSVLGTELGSSAKAAIALKHGIWETKPERRGSEEKIIPKEISPMALIFIMAYYILSYLSPVPVYSHCEASGSKETIRTLSL